MKLTRAPNDAERGWTSVLASENDVIRMGVFRVMSGWRVRAGFTADKVSCVLDWCGGSDRLDVAVLYDSLRRILEARLEDEDAFEMLPQTSRVKPAMKDDDFVRVLAAQLRSFHDRYS